ncbi:hypothetical protein MPSEU_000389600 [Mayamaea pseudoterrestris]|nr:hypothetical protein MPSEU_000389600 [Mayamaea pseudoterrestris]
MLSKIKCLNRGNAHLILRRSVRAFSDDAIEHRIFPSRTKLDLDETFIEPFLFSIGQLPEIHDALEARKLCRPVNLDELERATKVFSSIQPGGGEHKAALALLADSQDPPAAVKTLKYLQNYQQSRQEQFSVQISLAKALWLGGDFEGAESTCSHLLQNDTLLSNLSPLHTASARTGQAISRICAAESLDHVFSVRDPFRMVVKSLEGGSSQPALALARLNYGTAEAIYAHIVARENKVHVPLDGAMRAWKQGLATLRKGKDASLLTYAIEAQLLIQLAWGLLQMGDEIDIIKRASEFAAEALDIYDNHGGGDGEGMWRQLFVIIGTCLHKTGSAVMAEGIFQKATHREERSRSTLDRLQLRSAFQAHAELCQEWEKRERDAERLQAQALEVESALPMTWKHKPALYSTLWFWTPSQVVISK